MKWLMPTALAITVLGLICLVLPMVSEIESTVQLIGMMLFVTGIASIGVVRYLHQMVKSQTPSDTTPTTERRSW